MAHRVQGVTKNFMNQTMTIHITFHGDLGSSCYKYLVLDQCLLETFLGLSTSGVTETWPLLFNTSF